MTQIYLQLTRNRTGEVITLTMERGLEIIREYDKKQRFMNILGQEEYWKKNRLTLWKELNNNDVVEEVKTELEELNKINKSVRDKIVGGLMMVEFEHTERMLVLIAYRMEEHLAAKFRTREEQAALKTEAKYFSHQEDYHYDYNTGRGKSLRSRRVMPQYIIVRHADLENFNREMTALYDKYGVKDSSKLRKGKRYFDVNELAKRYYRKYYKMGK
jgi:hypothetical protein